MSADDFQAPFDTDEETNADARPPEAMPEVDPEVARAREAFDADAVDAEDDLDDPAAVEAAVPFVGRWQQLISTTNWEKGRIIVAWRSALIETGVDATQYSDAAWVRRVGGVTAPHVGRLRRVFERFGDVYETYQGVHWTHFLAALDWEDAPMWLQGAAEESWSVSQMRTKRWEAMGMVDSQRPTSSQNIEVDLDEDAAMPAGDDTTPAQGGGGRVYNDDEPTASAADSIHEVDFGEEPELNALADGDREPSGATDGPKSTPVRPFAELPELPDDLSDAVESLKLAVLRHKSAGWRDVDETTIAEYLRAFEVLLRS